ncbi:MAG: phage tail tape measure protein, partial [Oscillospiraceae bacterium]|nr:phage tail tape measure protein [Oscillospiraceae bacterium]
MAADGRLMFETGIDNSGFSNGVSNLQATANVAMGNIAANMVSKVSSAAAQIPQQIITVGSGFEASMSQVAATMGITSAAAEFKTLSAAAKEMGETTKFSASQAGEALNYLALAGYDANKAVAALPTVLNVAAAGGMELASASDMVTDAMSALGLETSQMADFSDKLAVTAQKSNTSVSQLGEAILTVGGTAKMLSGGVTEMNTALGILADNGIKGSEGGTALRNVILSLSAPTDTAAAALESLGVTAFDASGSMRPLEDTFADLNTALSTLSDQERTAVLNEIFNKVDLKSVNALLGTSSERFDELSGYISDCAGAAAQMAETMDDNLKGDLTIMQSALEGLGIAAYEKFQVPFRDAVQEVTGYIGDLSLSIADGNLSASVEKISVGFGSLAESAIKIVGNNVIPTIASGLEIIVDHANSLKIIISLVTAEFVAMKAAAILTPIITSITAANTALTLLAAETSAATFQQAALASGMSFTEIAVGLFTGKITAATAAEAAFNAVCAINPVVLLATALAALGVAIGAIVSDMKNATEETNEYAVALENARSSAVQITKDSDKEIAVIQRKSERYEELRQRFEELTDGEMAEFLDLVEELQGILPEGTKIIDEQSGAYLNLADNIEKVTERMHLQAALSAKYEEYSVAASNYYDIQEKLNSLESSILPENRLKADPEGILSDLDDKSYMNQLAKARYGLSYDELVATQKENKKILEDYDNLKEQTYAQIENSDSASSLSVPILPFINSNISRATEISGKIKGILNDQQKETTSALESAWKQAEHAHATGVIATEAELYRQKSALLEQYGNADLEDHWKYYEDLYAYQKESAENSIRLAEEA